MLARQEEEQYDEVETREQRDRERRELAKRAKQPLYKTVLDKTKRLHAQILFCVMAIMAMLVTLSSGIGASRGYALINTQRQASELEQENERLKIEIAHLKSPDRIKSIATDQLGMQIPKRTYFAKDNQ